MTPAAFGDRRMMTGLTPEVDRLLSWLRYVHIRRGHLPLKVLNT